MDSLLDTVTNVVGILVILLAVTQTGVSTAIERIRANLPEISLLKYRQARREFDEHTKRLAELTRTWEKRRDHPPRYHELEALRKEIEKLQRRLKELAATKPELERIRRDVAKYKKQAAALDKQLQDAEAKLATLRAKLDNTPVPEAPPPTAVHLPDPRAAPKDAKCIWAMCRQGRCLFVYGERLQEIALDAIRKGGRGLLYKRPEPRKPPDKTKEVLEFDGKKLVALFKKHRIGTRDFRLLVRAYDDRAYAYLEIVPEDGRGETPEEMRARQSVARRVAQLAKRTNAYLRFLVSPDGFEAYLMARKVATAYAVPAGWLPYSAPYWRTVLHDVRIYKLKEPPPRPPAKQPAGPAPPPDVVD